MSTLPPTLPDFPTTLPPPAPPYTHRHRHGFPVLHSVLAGVLVFSLFIVLAIAYRKLSRKRTAPSDLKSPLQQPQQQLQQFSYNVLRRATSAFAATNRLGQGGFGSVYKGALPSGKEIAVKLMNGSGSLQGEREFHNELSLSTRINGACGAHSRHVISVLGFSSDQNRRRRRKMLIVYEYMQNGSLQDALLYRKCPELMDWKIRFMILLDVAKGIEFLHFSCDPPIVHCDIKPSNVLLDCSFNAKVADFGLARVLGVDENEIIESFLECGEEEGDQETETADDNNTDVEKKRENIGDYREENRSVAEETESVATGEVVVNMDPLSPESCSVTIVDVEAPTSEYLERASVSDQVSVDSSNRRFLGRKKSAGGPGGGGSGRDWWWKQDSCGGDSGRVKDYVMEWIGSEIKKERPKKDWLTTTDPISTELEASTTNAPQKKQKRKSETEKKNRKPREWWKEEFCDELSKKKKKKKKRGSNNGEMWWQHDEEFVPQKKKSKSSSKGSIDWWLEGLSGEFRHRRRNSQECAGGEIPKSGGISSTPSMRGTVCYIAPEKCDGGQLSEKSDVYSYGVLLLVLVSGRRPLQVTASPMSEFERANLISWARQLARNGKLLDLVDPNIHSLDQEQAMLCITTALLCLQRSPVKRPTMREIVGMLSGEAEPPHLPFEFSPSPPTNFPFKSRRKPG
ncbi:receptor-like serine/threonine-protein kinase At2g45590 [Cynara cardunculus var. scolymus]|uniref:non-specific serine/threonine protein kinase n=1 Tax=Cynara cardunculus var. scolymus TaxID=59895 RepID=A0A103XEF8_CYNCS|nr:receptor-like serine/threonine-protein kinase At2g45590 [Cynara cardunculus var. scolymus]KVH89163.1 Concanavalin A-like lectin/glucanase, subgroup [Cynara cardunculus var. scolymus]